MFGAVAAMIRSRGDKLKDKTKDGRAERQKEPGSHLALHPTRTTNLCSFLLWKIIKWLFHLANVNRVLLLIAKSITSTATVIISGL